MGPSDPKRCQLMPVQSGTPSTQWNNETSIKSKHGLPVSSSWLDKLQLLHRFSLTMPGSTNNFSSFLCLVSESEGSYGKQKGSLLFCFLVCFSLAVLGCQHDLELPVEIQVYSLYTFSIRRNEILLTANVVTHILVVAVWVQTLVDPPIVLSHGSEQILDLQLIFTILKDSKTRTKKTRLDVD